MNGETSTTIQVDGYKLLIAAATIGIPTGLMLSDPVLLRLSCDQTLLGLAFAQREQWLRGAIVEAFCLLYEHDRQRDRHDALLTRALESSLSLENGLNLGIRAARLGGSRQLARVSVLMSRQCDVDSGFLRAHKSLFESHVAARRGMRQHANDLALAAAAEFERAGRPFQRALALESAGRFGDAEEVRQHCGAQPGSMRLLWYGASIPQLLTAKLTPRETEIASLVTDGSTNRSIALKLGLSERTVQHHCEAIFGKLGVRSRWQLSEVFSQRRT